MYINTLVQLMVSLLEKNGECSVARLRMLVFVCDWVALTLSKRRLTDLVWHSGTGGPYSPVMDETIEQYSKYFALKEIVYAGTPRRVIGVNPTAAAFNFPRDPLSEEVAEIVVRLTKDLDPAEFMRNVNGLYPVQTTPKYAQIDLEEKFREYQSVREGKSP